MHESSKFGLKIRASTSFSLVLRGIYGLLLFGLAGLGGISSVAYAQALIPRSSAGWEALETLHALGKAPGLVLTHAPLSRHTVFEVLENAPDSLLSAEEREYWASHIAPPALFEGPSWGVHPLFTGYVGRDEAQEVRAFSRVGVQASFETSSVFAEGRVLHSRPLPAFFASLATQERGRASDAEAAPYTEWTASLGYRSRFFDVRAGRDRHQWGHGISSVILSDHGAPYPYVQFRTRAWRIEYVNLYVALKDRHTILPGRSRPNTRYAAMHRAHIELPRGFEIGFFEQVVHTDTTGTRHGIDRLYLNPLVFYRSVEQDIGSPDNALLGVDGSWRARPGVLLYGQLTLDEFESPSLIGEENWKNKWGWLYGARLAGWPLRHTTVEVERATLRPYLYSHQSSSTAFVHEYQTLGHPAGPNSRETLLRLRWEPSAKWRADLLAMSRTHGRDEAGSNLGGDPTLPYTSRPSNDARLFQGVWQRTRRVEGLVSRTLAPQTWLDAGFQWTHTRDELRGSSSAYSLFLGLRLGLHPIRYRG